MLSDVWTVMRTEWGECFSPSVRLQSFGVIATAPLAGVVTALPWALDWYSSGRWEEFFVTSTASVAWLATIGFALRDRKRSNPAARLVSGLPRDAILFGRIGAGVGFGWAFWLLMAAVSMLTLCLMRPDGPWALTSLHAMLAVVALELLISISAGTGATLIALGASTVRQVYKFAFAVFGGLALAVFAVVWFQGGWSAVRFLGLQRLSVPMQFAMAFLVAFAVLDFALILYGRARFRGMSLVQE